MSATRTPAPQRSSPANHRGDGRRTSSARGVHLIGFNGAARYWVPKESRFTPFLGLALAIFALGTFVGTLLPQEEKLPPMIEVDLGIDGVENEPPPLGEPDAGAGEQIEQPPAEPEKPEMAEEVPPPPEPEPEPEPAPATEPVPPPEFVVPKEPEPEPSPKPKPVVKAAAKPKAAPKQEAKPAAAPFGSGIVGARAGTRGSPGGKPGGKGGGRGDFIQTPSPTYDATAKQRRYEGSGNFFIRYENGRITGVSAANSTGVPYLDARTITWIKTRWRVKSGTSGAATLPITWKLR